MSLNILLPESIQMADTWLTYFVKVRPLNISGPHCICLRPLNISGPHCICLVLFWAGPERQNQSAEITFYNSA